MPASGAWPESPGAPQPRRWEAPACWVQRLTEEAPPAAAAAVGATLSGAGGTGRKGGTLNCWGVPGGGRKWGLYWAPCRLPNLLAQNLATWEENVYFFPLLSITILGFVLFYSFIFLKTPSLSPMSK